MKVILYKNSCENKRVDKTEYLNAPVILQGTLRESTSIITPSIYISTKEGIFFNENTPLVYLNENNEQVEIDEVFTQETLLFNYNYMYIEDFNRYYYITDIISVNNGLWLINAKIDPLMSFKNEIKSVKAFVTRNENDYNPLVKDDMVSFYYDKEITETNVSQGSKVNTIFNPNISITTNHIVINIINTDISVNISSVISPSQALPNVQAHTTGTGATSTPYATYPLSLTRLARWCIADDNVASNVLSIITFPFEIATSGSEFIVKSGNRELGGDDPVYVQNLDKKMSPYLVVADFTYTPSENTFFNYEPYATYELFIPYLSWVSISADNLLNKRILVIYQVDYSNGSAQVSIVNDTDKRVLYVSTCQLGVMIPLTTTNATEVENNKLTNNISLGLGLTTSALTTVLGAVTYNPIAVMGGLMGGASTIANYVNNTNNNYEKGSGSVASGLGGLYLPQSVRIRKTSFKKRNYTSNYFSIYGRPLNAVKTLSELTGITICNDFHLEGFPNATETEINEIENQLKSGVIL